MLNSLEGKIDLDAKARYELLAIRDIQDATDLMRPVYDSANCKDGFVSLEVSPYLARNDTQGTIDEARRLWKAVGRDNVMIKVPGTPEGLPAIQQLISEGININVTLLFAQEVYEQVAEAYIAGLEESAAGGGDLSSVASVASFFISRIDTLDRLHDRRKAEVHQRTRAASSCLKSMLGKVAIANGKLTYQKYQQIFSGPRWETLAQEGRADPARALGQHQHQESELSRRSLRGRTDRQGHRQHHSARDLRCFPRSRQASRTA